MTDLKISELATRLLDGSEEVALAFGGENFKATVAAIAALADGVRITRGTTAARTTTSTSWADVTGFSVTHTVLDATKTVKIDVVVSASLGSDSRQGGGFFRIVRLSDGQVIGPAGADGSAGLVFGHGTNLEAGGVGATLAFSVFDDDASAGAETYKLQFKVGAAGIGLVLRTDVMQPRNGNAFGGGTAASSITASELREN